MLCPKCKAEIPDDSVHCSSCGGKISDEAPAPGGGAASMLTLLIKADPKGALSIVGSFFIILGAFLPWATAYGTSLLGVGIAQGAVLLLVGVLFLAALVLSRSGAAGAWNVVMLLLSLLALALIFQSICMIGGLYYSGATEGAGVWLAMVGALAITAAALLGQFGTAKK